MSIYSEAVASIRNYSETKQRELNDAAHAARAASIDAVRKLAVAGVDHSSPAYAVCQLVAQTIHVGRESDGYPSVTIPAETRKALTAACAAGLLERIGRTVRVGGLDLYVDFSGLSHDPREISTDYQCWDAAREYAKAQTWQSL